MTPNISPIVIVGSVFVTLLMMNLTIGYYFENRSLRFDLQSAKSDNSRLAQIAEDARDQREQMLRSTCDRYGFYPKGDR